MQNSHSSKGAAKVSVWWLFLVNGILILPVILLAAITAQGRYVYLAPYLSAVFGVTAVLNIVVTFLNRRKIAGWGLMLAPSIVLILLSGFIAFVGLTTKINESVFAFYVGFAFFFASFFTVSFSFTMKTFTIKLWPLTFSFSILTMLLSMGLFLYPIHETLMLQTWTAFAFTSLLLTYLMTAFLLLSANKKANKISLQATEI